MREIIRSRRTIIAVIAVLMIMAGIGGSIADDVVIQPDEPEVRCVYVAVPPEARVLLIPPKHAPPAPDSFTVMYLCGADLKYTGPNPIGPVANSPKRELN